MGIPSFLANTLYIRGRSSLKEKRMQEFMDKFETEIFPTIKGEDGKGIERFRKVVEKKREEVKQRKQKRDKCPH